MASQFDKIVEVLVEYGEQQVADLIDSLKSKGFVHGGGQLAAIAGTIRFTVERAGQNVVYQLHIADYYRYIDEGRRAGKHPPPEAIREWITTKGINPVSVLQQIYKKSGLNVPKSARKFSTAIKSLGFLIGRKIAREGTIKRFGNRGSNFYSDVVTQESINELTQKIARITGRQVLAEVLDAAEGVNNTTITIKG